MDQTPRTEELMVTCYRCGQPILLGQGRYNVLPDESYCSFECLRQSLPQPQPDNRPNSIDGFLRSHRRHSHLCLTDTQCRLRNKYW